MISRDDNDLRCEIIISSAKTHQPLATHLGEEKNRRIKAEASRPISVDPPNPIPTRPEPKHARTVPRGARARHTVRVCRAVFFLAVSCQISDPGQ